MKKKYHLHLKGYVGGFDFSADYVEYTLDKHKNEQVNVLINSLGGSVATALTVSAAFARHGNVHVHYESMNASAATIASLGAKRVSIDRQAMYLVHKCSQEFFLWDGLNADQLDSLIANLEKTKNDLNKIDLNIAGGYAARCRKDKQQLLELMKRGGWLNAEEALEWGFVDEITDLPEDEEPRMTAQVRDFMAAEGIPVPNLPVENDDDNERGLIARLKEFLRSLYANNNETTNQLLSTMKKNFASIAAALALALFECEEGGSANLTDEQLNKLDGHINALQAQVDEARAALAGRDSEIHDLQARLAAAVVEIADLTKKPADDSKRVITQAHAATDGETFPMDRFCDEMHSAREMLNNLKK